MLGSEPEKRLQVRWSALKKLIDGETATLELAEGARVEGRIRKVTDNALIFKVKKSSEPADYPKAEIQIPRVTISRIEVRGLKQNKVKRVGRTVGTFCGAFLGSLAVALSTGSDSGATVGQGVAVVAIPTAAAVLVYRALAPKDITVIEILPIHPVKGSRNPQSTEKVRTRQLRENHYPWHSLRSQVRNGFAGKPGER